MKSHPFIAAATVALIAGAGALALKFIGDSVEVSTTPSEPVYVDIKASEPPPPPPPRFEGPTKPVLRFDESGKAIPE